MKKAELRELLAAMQEVSVEITRVNQAAGHTVFNPAATGLLRSQMRAVEAALAPMSREDRRAAAVRGAGGALADVALVLQSDAVIGRAKGAK